MLSRWEEVEILEAEANLVKSELSYFVGRQSPNIDVFNFDASGIGTQNSRDELNIVVLPLPDGPTT